MDNQHYLDNLRHSAAHLLAAAVMEIWPNTKRTIGPAIEHGFYFDFEFEEAISEKDFVRIEQKMREILKTWKGFERHELSAADASKEYPHNPFKQELIEEFSKEGQTLTFYKSGNYWDLCKGGHVDNPKNELKHFKLLSVAGAYWRGSEKNPMLTRIYGTAFPSKEELEAHLNMLEEAKKRDHRKIGRELELFFIDEVIGKGLIMWLPKGTVMRDEIENLAKEMEKKAGYMRVVSPHIAKEELFLTSGHLPYYKDSMYPPMVMDDGTYYLKAMNCPHHHRMFLHKTHTYKEMPIRYAEYGTCYRNELSGALSGLLRVRCLAMNDAHIYCTKDQIKEEFAAVLKLTMDYFKIFGLENYWFRLSKWDPKNQEKYINQPENWTFSEGVLREVLQEMGLPFKEVDDEAAFYGPKVDVQFKSAIGREETMSTIQLDFAAKERFNLTYIDKDGKENDEIFVIHRAPLSVHERFMAFLIEHYAGNFPLWLSPVQVKIVPISEKHNEYAHQLQQQLIDMNIRAEVDTRDERMQRKIRDAQLEKAYYMLVAGDKEVEASAVNVRQRNGEQHGTMSIEDFVQKAKEEITNRTNN